MWLASSVKADPQSLPFLLQSLLSSSFTAADDAASHGLTDVFPGAADADVPSRSGGDAYLAYRMYII